MDGDFAQTVIKRLDVIGTNIEDVRKENEVRDKGVEIRFDHVDSRMDRMDRRFDAADSRFDTMDRQFDAMDNRFDAIDSRLDNVESLRAVVSNSNIFNFTQKVSPLQGVNGPIPQCFPSTAHQFFQLQKRKNWGKLKELLTYYCLERDAIRLIACDNFDSDSDTEIEAEYPGDGLLEAIELNPFLAMSTLGSHLGIDCDMLQSRIRQIEIQKHAMTGKRAAESVDGERAKGKRPAIQQVESIPSQIEMLRRGHQTGLGLMEEDRSQVQQTRSTEINGTNPATYTPTLVEEVGSNPEGFQGSFDPATATFYAPTPGAATVASWETSDRFLFEGIPRSSQKPSSNAISSQNTPSGAAAPARYTDTSTQTESIPSHLDFSGSSKKREYARSRRNSSSPKHKPSASSDHAVLVERSLPALIERPEESNHSVASESKRFSARVGGRMPFSSQRAAAPLSQR